MTNKPQTPDLTITPCLFLDNVLVLGGSEENYDRVMSEYGKKVATTRSTAIRWVAVPVG